MITDDLTIKYNIPDYYKKMIDIDFLTLFIKKLLFFDPEVFEPYPEFDEEGEKIIKPVVRMDDGTIIFNELNLEGTGIWYDTFKEVCEKFDKLELFEYWKKLPYYDSDLFDDELGSMMAKMIVEKQEWK